MDSVATYLEILHSMIQERRGDLGEAVWGHKGLGPIWATAALAQQEHPHSEPLRNPLWHT